jgi:hypothetical protein
VEGNPDLEKELSVLISNNDEDGLEEFLTNLKGVPGLSVLRKATKKALKKMKDDKSAPEPKPHKQREKASASGQDAKPTKKAQAAQKATAVAASQPSINLNPASTAGSQHGPLLKVVSRTQSAVGGPAKGGTTNTKSAPASARAECVMHMAPTVVGWVIGKGGQRIRDMMEESGAKIWIDQESMGDNDARVVYVSGKRSSVDSAVRMVKDLISKAPVSASAAAAAPTQGSAPASVTAAPQATTAVSKSPSPVVTAPVPVSDSAPSFAAAASHVSKQTSPAVVTAQPSKPVPKKIPAPGWSNADAVTVSHPPPKTAAAPVSKPAPHTTVDNIDESTKSIASMMSASRQPPETVRSEISCDPQFIALLLGRDGLAAKSIQTESGASLHINQTIAPGTIGISGKAENVTKAEQLIYGVLKYRDEQLKQEAQKVKMRPDMSLNQVADPYANERRMRTDNISTMPSMQLHNLQRTQEDVQFQNQRPPQIPGNPGRGEHNMVRITSPKHWNYASH